MCITAILLIQNLSAIELDSIQTLNGADVPQVDTVVAEPSVEGVSLIPVRHHTYQRLNQDENDLLTNIGGLSVLPHLYYLDGAVVFISSSYFDVYSLLIDDHIKQAEYNVHGYSVAYGDNHAGLIDMTSRRGGLDSSNSYYQGSKISVGTFNKQVSYEGHHSGFRWFGGYRNINTENEFLGIEEFALEGWNDRYSQVTIQGGASYDITPDQDIRFTLFSQSQTEQMYPSLSTESRMYALNYTVRSITEGLDLSVHGSQSSAKNVSGFRGVVKSETNLIVSTVRNELSVRVVPNHTITGVLALSSISNGFKQVFSSGAQYTDSTRTESVVVETEHGDSVEVWLGNASIEDQWSVGNARITPGARMSYHFDMKEFTFDPRFTLDYALTAFQKVTIHVGEYTQFINTSGQPGDFSIGQPWVLLAQQTPYRSISPSRSRLYSIQYAIDDILSVFSATASLSYQSFENLYGFGDDDTTNSAYGKEDAVIEDYITLIEGNSYGASLTLSKSEGALEGFIEAGYYTAIHTDATGKTSRPYSANWSNTISYDSRLSIVWKGRAGLFYSDWQWSSAVRYRYVNRIYPPSTRIFLKLLDLSSEHWRTSLSFVFADGDIVYGGRDGYNELPDRWYPLMWEFEYQF